MRVITGAARGRLLETLPGEDIVRPTAQRVKEGVFSAIQFKIEGARVLDLFAGSGQLGIEALSRGACRCVFVDESREAACVVTRNLKRTGLDGAARVTVSGAERFLQHRKDPFDIVFVDPPYRKGLAEKVLKPLSEVVAEGGTVMCETERECVMPDRCGRLELKKSYRYGKTMIWMYTRPFDDGEEKADD